MEFIINISKPEDIIQFAKDIVQMSENSEITSEQLMKSTLLNPIVRMYRTYSDLSEQLKNDDSIQKFISSLTVDKVFQSKS